MRIVVLSDIHIPYQMNGLSTLFRRIKRELKPDLVISVGDMVDQYCFGKYTRDPDAMSARSELTEARSMIKSLSRELKEITIVKGNHECVEVGTEVLTTTGWKLAENITKKDVLQVVDLTTGILVNSPVIAHTKFTEDGGFYIRGDSKRESVNLEHSVVHNNKLVKVSSLARSIKQNELFPTFRSPAENVEPFSTMDKLLLFILADATLVGNGVGKTRIQFKLSRSEKIEELMSVLEELKIPYTIKVCKKYGVNVLQPYYIRIYGDSARMLYKLLGGTKSRLPKILDRNYGDSIIDFCNYLRKTDGSTHYNHLVYSSADSEIIEDLQKLLIRHGIFSKVKVVNKVGAGGFNKRLTNVLSIYPNGLFDRSYINIEQHNNTTTFVGIQSTTGTLITRNEGVVTVTGNCRIYKRAVEAGLPANMIKSLAEIFELPSGWKYVDGPLEIPLTDDGLETAIVVHGEQFGGSLALRQMIQQYRQNIICGHLHGQAGILYLNNGVQDLTWSMIVGCLVDHDSIAFQYGKNNRDREVLTFGLIVDGIPQLIPAEAFL